MLAPAVLLTLAQQCAPNIHPETMRAIVEVESAGNPYAIGVVNGRLQRQPKNLDEAVATARALKQGGWNFSLGVGQINRYNLSRYGLTYETAFSPCNNLRAAAAILSECYQRAALTHKAHKGNALGAALSCYYSGNFSTGYRHGYVQKVVAQAQAQTQSPAASRAVPSIAVIPNKKGAAPAVAMPLPLAPVQPAPVAPQAQPAQPVNPALVF